MDAETRTKQIAQIWQDNRWLFTFCGWVIGLITLPLLNQLSNDFVAFIELMIPHIITAAFIIFILNRLTKQREIENYKHQLKLKARSQNNVTVIDAINEIRFNGWLVGKNGLLKGANLSDTPLEKTNLKEANLEGANLKESSFDSAILDHANLSNTNLWTTWLSHASLIGANLENAKMGESSLFDSQLAQANLKNAHLLEVHGKNADFTHANLAGAYFYASRFEGSRFALANAQCADFSVAYLIDTNFERANLQYAKLVSTNLCGANLKDANLHGAFVCDKVNCDDIPHVVRMDETTILPDGTNYIPDLGIKQLVRFGAIVEPLTDQEIKEQQIIAMRGL